MNRIYVLKIWLMSMSVSEVPANTFYCRSWDGADALTQTLGFVRAPEWSMEGPWIYTRGVTGAFYRDHAEVRLERVDA
jgi:hypothetical protein